MKTAKKTTGRGGPREGSGRPAIYGPEPVDVSVRLPSEVVDALDSRRQRDGLTRSAAVAAALRAWLGDSH